MASGHDFMENRGRKVEVVTDVPILGSKITADGDCSHEIRRHLLLGRKAMTNLESVLKSRDFADKAPYSQGYGPLRVSWTAKGSNHSILREINPE